MNDNRSHSTFSLQKRYRSLFWVRPGVVGQRFLRRIADHPWFYPAFLAASDRSAGKNTLRPANGTFRGSPMQGTAT